MATKHDLTLIKLIAKLSKRWRMRFDAFEDAEAAKLGVIFSDYEQARRLKVLAFLGSLRLDANGIIENSAENLEEVTQALKDLKKLQLDSFDKQSSFGKWVDRNYDKAAKMGVLKAKDSYKIGEGKALPTGYTPPTARLVRQTKQMTFMQVTNRNQMDLDLMKQSFLRSIYDPTATVQSLRQELVDRGQVEGLVDTIGRRITASERADRIAKYELSALETQAQQETVADIYHDGEQSLDDYWLWVATLDGRQGHDSEVRNGQVLTMKQWRKKDFGDRYTGRIKPLRPRDRCDMVNVQPEWFSKDIRKKYFNSKIGTPIQSELAA